MKYRETSARKILMIDGHGLAFRGFYALPEMNAPDGTPTNALLGFTNMLLKAVEEWSPDGIGLFFDPKGPTARNKLYEDYKAGRKPTPEAFKAQMPLILELSRAMGFPVLIRDEVEADDLIASSAIAASEEGYETVILSADKDLLQLLRDGIKMARPSKGISEFKFYDSSLFAEEFGFEPCFMADYLALAGDSADNIPGVPGIGDKTARSLISEFGSLDNIYKSLELLKPRQRTLLENGRESAYRSYELVIPQKVDAVSAELLVMSEMDRDAVRALCGRLGLKKLLSRLGLDAREESSEVKTDGDKENNEKKAPEIPALRIDLLDDVTPREVEIEELFAEPLLVLSDNPNVLMASDGRWSELKDSNLGRFGGWLSINRLILADYRAWCTRLPILREHPADIWDAELAHYFLHPDAKSHSLESALGRYPGMGEERALEILRFRKSLNGSDFIDDINRVMAEIDSPLTPVLLELEERGLYVDRDAMSALERDLAELLDNIEGRIFSIAGGDINLNSPKQVGELLFERLHLPVIKRTKTGYSTDVSVLEELAALPEPLGDIPRMMLEHRECSKMLSGFVQPFLKHALDSPDGRIHSTFLHNVTGTGRLASRDPNVQNLPVFGDWAVRFRSTIKPMDSTGVFVGADYSQIELRVLAHLSKEKRLLEAFSNNRDVHLETASWVFGLDAEQITSEQRRFAKMVNFGLIYGMSAHGLAQRMGIQRNKAAELVERYFSVLPGVKRYLAESEADARSHGHTKSLFGRIRPLAEVTTVEGRGGNSMGRVSVNTPIQSTAADIAKVALLRMNDELKRSIGDEGFVVLQVHDSIICEVPESRAEETESLLTRVMESVRCIDVPLKAEPKRGRSLAEM